MGNALYLRKYKQAIKVKNDAIVLRQQIDAYSKPIFAVRRSAVGVQVGVPYLRGAFKWPGDGKRDETC